jgi:hypothetical protein
MLDRRSPQEEGSTSAREKTEPYNDRQQESTDFGHHYAWQYLRATMYPRSPLTGDWPLIDRLASPAQRCITINKHRNRFTILVRCYPAILSSSPFVTTDCILIWQRVGEVFMKDKTHGVSYVTIPGDS